MKIINIAAVALNQTPLDWDRNVGNILAAMEDADQLEVSLLCFPELCITGYGCEDLFFAKFVQEKALMLLEVIRANVPKNMIVSVGLPLVFNNALYNVAAIIANNTVLGYVPKQHLCSDGIHYEPRWFKPWPAGVVDYTADDIPIGDLVFDVGGIRIGYEVCEDAWVSDRPGIKLAERAVDIILNPSASHFSFGKHEVRKRFVIEGSRAFRCVYIYSNLLGNESGKIVFDGDLIIASGGKVVSEGRRLSFLKYMLLPATVDIDENRTTQLQNGSFRPALNIGVEVINFFYRDVLPQNYNISDKYGIGFGASKEIEFQHVVALGLFDYMVKSRSNGFIVSLSGGADSSAVSCLVRSMYDIARKELGDDLMPAMNELLTCVYQSTINSSGDTKKSAASLAADIGADFRILDVDPIVDAYKKIIEPVIGRKLDWNQDDIALQNIQARVRSPGIWMLANIKGVLLLCTSNRSEAAVGFFSMDGDSSGGLSPIGGIDKSYLLSWLRWLATTNEMYSSALRYVNVLIPTAELKPLEAGQTDEKDLMPYDVLNRIEELAIRDKLSPAEVLFKLSHDESFAYDEGILAKWVNKFFKLFAQNQWKRERLASAIHLDDHNLDPKTWCRFPILSGGFEEEMAELTDE
jgi:NAD+ synthase (glutamine-hydrolysing)